MGAVGWHCVGAATSAQPVVPEAGTSGGDEAPDAATPEREPAVGVGNSGLAGMTKGRAWRAAVGLAALVRAPAVQARSYRRRPVPSAACDEAPDAAPLGACCNSRRGFWIPAFAGNDEGWACGGRWAGNGTGALGGQRSSPSCRQGNGEEAPAVQPSYRRRPVPSAAMSMRHRTCSGCSGRVATVGVGPGFRPSPE